MGVSDQRSRGATRRSWIRLVILALAAALLVTGCPRDIDRGDDGPSEYPGGRTGQLLQEARAQLAGHDVAAAQATYAEILAEEDPAEGSALAGKAVCDLLLLPGAPPVTALLSAHVGAGGAIDANAAIYADGGFLYWASRGTPWEDQDGYAGIRTAIADTLPWPQARLDTAEAFVAGLDQPVNAAMADLVAVADALAQIEREIDGALADPDFERLYIPGETFHDARVDLVLGRSELSLMASMISAARAGAYFLAAYDHGWTLEAAFGAGWQDRAAEDPDRADWQAIDWTIDYLDAHLGRAIAHPERLGAARDSLDASLGYARDALHFGLQASLQTTLRWDKADRQFAGKLDTLLQALQGALYQPTVIPFTDPQTTADLSSFFDGGRTLPAGVAWLERVSTTTTSSDASTTAESSDTGWWQVRDEAAQAFFVDGVFAPAFTIGADDAPQLTLDGEAAAQFGTDLTGEFEETLQRAYLR